MISCQHSEPFLTPDRIIVQIPVSIYYTFKIYVVYIYIYTYFRLQNDICYIQLVFEYPAFEEFRKMAPHTSAYGTLQVLDLMQEDDTAHKNPRVPERFFCGPWKIPGHLSALEPWNNNLECFTSWAKL